MNGCSKKIEKEKQIGAKHESIYIYRIAQAEGSYNVVYQRVV